MENFIELSDVYKRYRMGEVTINAVSGVSFRIARGEFAVIVGASGAGKTTVLNILGGMDNCDEGRITVDGQPVHSFSTRQLAAYRLRIPVL